MDNINSNEEESLLRMQKEMDNLKQRESELARRIAEANQRQKSLSRENLQETDKARRGSGSPRRNSSGGSPTRDYFQGRNIESKVAKYIRGEDPYRRKKRDDGNRNQPMNQSSSGGSRSTRRLSNPDETQLRKDTPRYSALKDQGTGLRKSSPNLSTIADPLAEDNEVLSDDDGVLRSRSKKGRYSSTGHLDNFETKERTTWDSSQSDIKTTTVSIEIQSSGSRKSTPRRSSQDLINLGDSVDDNYELNKGMTDPDENESPEVFPGQELNLTQEGNGSAIDIDSIVWSGNTTREEEGDLENEKSPRRVNWNPDDILLGNRSSEINGKYMTTADRLENEDLLSKQLQETEKNITYSDSPTFYNENYDFSSDSPEETSAREQILDAKSKIELEIEELRQREIELKATRLQQAKMVASQTGVKATSENYKDNGEEEDEVEADEYFEANETLSADGKGIIEREIQELKEREMEYKHRQKMIYGEILNEESDEETTQKCELAANVESYSSGLKGKIENEMIESLKREHEHQNRFCTNEELSVNPVSYYDEEEEPSSDEETNKGVTMDAVTKIEIEIEEVKQREEELKRTRNVRVVTEEGDEADIEWEPNSDKVEAVNDPLTKIEMEIEKDRRRDLELKKRYGLRVNNIDNNGYDENDAGIFEEERGNENDNEEVYPKFEKSEKQEKLNIQGSMPGKVKIPEAFKSIQSTAMPMLKNTSPGKAAQARPFKETETEESLATEVKTRPQEANNDDLLRRSFYNDSNHAKAVREQGVAKKQAGCSFREPLSESETEVEEQENIAPTVVDKYQQRNVKGTNIPKRLNDPDVTVLKTGFTKEKIFLFDPHKKPVASKVKETRISKARRMFEESVSSNANQTSKSKSPTREYKYENGVKESLKQSISLEKDQSFGRSHIDEKESHNDSHRRSGKKFILKKKITSKSKSDENLHSDFNSEENNGRKMTSSREHMMHNGDQRLHNSATGTGKYKKDDCEYGEQKMKKRMAVEPSNRSQTKAFSSEQVKQRDSKRDPEYEREKRRSLADSWEKKGFITQERDGDDSLPRQTKSETIYKAKPESRQKKVDHKKNVAKLKSSAQLRVQQWEQMIASRAQVSDN